jgi:hypothetical protein
MSPSNVDTSLFPVRDDPGNPGNTIIYTKKELLAAGLTESGPTSSSQVDRNQVLVTVLPQLDSVTLAEILSTIPASTVIMKLDIEGYECRALQPDILLGRTGKSIPLIFLEWMWLPGRLTDDREGVPCPGYRDLLHLFHAGGYTPFYPGTGPGGPGVLDPVPSAKLDFALDLVWVHTNLTGGTHKAIWL